MIRGPTDCLFTSPTKNFLHKSRARIPACDAHRLVLALFDVFEVSENIALKCLCQY